jgi:hypothetical protein
MAVTIRIPGVEDYFDGSANVKTLIAGPHGVGKTRWASFWDRPILLAIEDGTASVLDRGLPTADLRTYKDVMDVLSDLARQQMKAVKDKRQFRTVIVDTADKLQRRLMDEWSKLNNGQEFTGWEAWGWLDVRWNAIMDKLMELDYHVLVLMHYKDEKDGDSLLVRPRLKGDAQNTILDPFDLIGFMDYEWGVAPKEGDQAAQRTKKRVLSYEPTPKAPFLKDRFNVMPRKLTVNLETGEGAMALFDALQARAESLPSRSTLGTIGAEAIADSDERPGNVAGPMAGGPVEGAAAPKAPAKRAPAKAAPAEPSTEATGQSAESGPAPTSRAAQLAAEARARQAAKAAPETPAQEQASAFVEAAQAEVDQTTVLDAMSDQRAALATSQEAPVEDPPSPLGGSLLSGCGDDAASESASVEDAAPAGEQAVTPTSEETSEPASETPVQEPETVEEAVTNLEAGLGAVTEVDAMHMPVKDGVGSGPAGPVCGSVVAGAVPPDDVAAYVESGQAGCGEPLIQGSNDTFNGVGKVRYRMQFCNECFTKVRTNVK